VGTSFSIGSEHVLVGISSWQTNNMRPLLPVLASQHDNPAQPVYLAVVCEQYPASTEVLCRPLVWGLGWYPA
jgi:hypothetical protein